MPKRAAFRSGFLRKRPEFALTCIEKSNKIGVSNRRANGPLMQLNVNFNGSRRLVVLDVTEAACGMDNARCIPVSVPIAGRTGGSLGEDGHASGGLRNCCSNYTWAGVA